MANGVYARWKSIAALNESTIQTAKRHKSQLYKLLSFGFWLFALLK